MGTGFATQTGSAGGGPDLGQFLFRASDVPAIKVDWLWPGRIALGKVTLLAGDPGLGKSLLTLDMAARVSRGGKWPGEESSGFGIQGSGGDPEVGEPTTESRALRPGASAIIFSDEDDVSDTIRPRLDAAGADCGRVFVVPAFSGKDDNGEYRRAFELSRDLARLDGMLARLPDCRLVVIDPISSYLGSSIENTNTEVRSLLGPLAALAAARNLAVVAVTHLRKKDGATIYRAARQPGVRGGEPGGVGRVPGSGGRGAKTASAAEEQSLGLQDRSGVSDRITFARRSRRAGRVLVGGSGKRRGRHGLGSAGTTDGPTGQRAVGSNRLAGAISGRGSAASDRRARSGRSARLHVQHIAEGVSRVGRRIDAGRSPRKSMLDVAVAGFRGCGVHVTTPAAETRTRFDIETAKVKMRISSIASQLNVSLNVPCGPNPCN